MPTATHTRARLRALPARTAALRVDREAGNGVIRGLAILSPGPAKGHGFVVDEETAAQVASLAEGAKGRWTHPNLCADGLGKYLGRWRNVRLAGGQAVGDFHFSPAAHQFRPKGLEVSAADYLMARAEEVEAGTESPDVLGVSVVAMFDLVEREGLAPLARATAVDAADFVDEPAANDGLFGDGPSELAAGATNQLNQIASEYGEGRVVAFLNAWLAERGQEKKPMTDTTTSESLARVQQLEEQLAARDARIAALEAAEAQRAAVALAERQAKNVAFVRDLQERSAKLQAPITAERLGLVERALERGDDETAKALAAAFLGECEAKARLAGVGADAVPLSSQAPDTDKQVAADVVARLQKQGINAQLSADGRSWTVAPRGAGSK